MFRAGRAESYGTGPTKASTPLARVRRNPMVLASMTGSAARFAPHLVLTLLITIWSASFVVSKVAQEHLTPFGLVAIRFWLAVACLLPFLRGQGTRPVREALGPGLAAGMALGPGYLLQMAGLAETTASTSGLLAGLIVPLVALGGFLFFRAHMGRLSLCGLALAIVGIAAICWPADAAPGAAKDTLRGILLQVGSSISYAGHVLLLSRFGRSAPIAAFATWQLVFVAIMGTVMAMATGGFAKDPVAGIPWTGELLFAIGYLGVLATAVGIGVQSKVQHRIPPTHLALLFSLQPLFAAVFGWALQGDRLGEAQLAGGGLIVLGVVVTSLDRSRGRP